MATYVNDLRLKEITTGDESGTWGTSTNTNLELIANAMGLGAEAIPNASTHTITMADGAADEFRSTFLRLTGGGQACTVTLGPSTLSHTWIMRNETAAALTLTQGSGANVVIAAGQTKIVSTDGGGSGAVVYEMDDLELAGNLIASAATITTLASSAATLTGGTVNGMVVGGSTPAAGTFTTLTANTSATVSGDLTVDTSTLKVDSTNNRVGILNASPDVVLDIGSSTDAVHMPVGTTGQRPTGAAGYFRYNSTLSQFEGYTDGWGAIGGGGGSNLVSNTMTGDGSTTTISLTNNPQDENNTQVYIDGTYQNKDTYSVSGTTLTFSTAPPLGTAVEVMTIEPTAINVPADASVTSAKLSGALVTPSSLTVTGALTGSNATFTTADNTDTLSLISTDADASAGPNLRMYRNSASPADSDTLGVIDFEGRNDNSQDVIYGTIKAKADDVSDGSEDSTILINSISAGTLRRRITLTPTEAIINDDGVDLDFRVESDGNANMLFVDGGNNNVNIGSTDQGGVRLGQVLNLTQTANFGGMSLSCYSTTNSHRHLLDFNKSGQATPGSHGVVADGEHLGSIFFRGDDGDEFIDGAQISAVVDGTPGNGDMPTMLTFSTTPDGAASSSERLRITNAGLVGIGAASPSSSFRTSIYGDGSSIIGGIEFRNGASGGSTFTVGHASATSPSATLNVVGAGNLTFNTNNTERMRIDSSGNLLVGKTSTAFGTAGATLYASGDNDFVNDGNIMSLNRLSSDGSIITFYKDSTAVGQINTVSTGGGSIIIGNDSSGIMFRGDLTTSAFIPASPATNAQVDNTLDVGHSAIRFDDIYATNPTIQTSDRNEKQDIEALSDAEQRVAVACKGLLRKFRWIDSVETKGDDARIHFGIIAQDLQDAFTAEGLDAGRYAMFISSTWWETQTEVAAVEATEDAEAVDAYTRTDTYHTAEEAPEGSTERTRLGIRSSELLAFIIAAI